MARGWESKSVAEQQALAAESKPTGGNQPLTPAEQQRRQQLDVLRLALQNTQCKLAEATHEGYREQLQASIRELERRIAALAR